MNKSLLFLLIAFVGCNVDNDLGPAATHFVAGAHNSFGSIYAGLPMGLILRDSRIDQSRPLKFEIDHGDQNKETYTFIKRGYTYAEAGNYRVQITIEQGGRQFTFDSVLQVVDAPKTYGIATQGEYARLLYMDNSGNTKLIFSTATLSGGFKNYNAILSSNLAPQFSVLMPGNSTSDHLVYFVPSPDGKIGLVEQTTVKIYNEADQLVKVVPVGNECHDMRFVNGDPQILYDSIHSNQEYICTKTLHLVTGNSTTKRSAFPASMWPLQNLFFSGSSTAFATFTTLGATNYVLREMDFDGNTLFERNNPEGLTFERDPPGLVLLSTGKLLISHHKLVKLDANNNEQWRLDIPYYGWIPEERVIVRESGNFIYVFFEDMRCLLLNQDGSVVWEKFYYPEGAAVVQSVLVEPNGNLLIAGNRIEFNNGPINQLSIENCDIVFIRIAPDGSMID